MKLGLQLMNASWPMLYKKTSTGAIQYWEVTTSANLIQVRYGQVGGAEQVTTDIINQGKNIGKKNETSSTEQAQAEAQSKWEKQKKKGYVETKEQAEAGETEHEGGINPMLAHKFSEQGHKIVYPAYVQPKLDGIRCVAIVEDGRCSLWTRTRKPITSVPHIAKELELAFPTGRHVLDGELYNHDFKKDFEKIVSLVRQEKPAPGHEVVQYHIYDIANDMKFESRNSLLLASWPTGGRTHLLLVPTYVAASEDELMVHFEYFTGLGYEGAMVRNAASPYANKRSYDLQKIKEFEDAEFEITGVKEGRGKLQGHAATFVCKMPDGQVFEAKMKGDTAKLKEYFENHALWTGKKLTVKFQGLTGKNGVPRFPVGIALRDYE